MMFGFIRRLFGHGKVRVEFVYSKGGRVLKGHAVIPYEGSYDEDLVIKHATNYLIVEHQIAPLKIVVVGRMEY
jgi:hypothetical protein